MLHSKEMENYSRMCCRAVYGEILFVIVEQRNRSALYS